ncbi:MAG: secondary thiamine-phosphate synthase enzyme YjbQ [Candidatus Heimdallarchaeota archaeon]|nr:secondary thiamine-phosphate synthase enzyme YjbQ [Candidatus Heimdallarchaeota archaeon]MDH5646125.1 secondary thiamine-phosphate synthase enzyme YjbQ [Candidatus Heimdallarchaeota archaeon]
MKEFSVKSETHTEIIDITDKVIDVIKKHNFKSGAVILYTPHTTASLTINEGWDPEVKGDIIRFLKKLIPWNEDLFNHSEGNSAAHIKSILIGNSTTIIVEDGLIQLGTWEKIFFCDFDGPRIRKVLIQFLASNSL